MLTSGPGGDGLPGMGFIICGVIAVQIHPIVIRVDLGVGSGSLWSHLIGGTNWRLEENHVDEPLPSIPAPYHWRALEGAGTLAASLISRSSQNNLNTHRQEPAKFRYNKLDHRHPKQEIYMC